MKSARSVLSPVLAPGVQSIRHRLPGSGPLRLVSLLLCAATLHAQPPVARPPLAQPPPAQQPVPQTLDLQAVVRDALLQVQTNFYGVLLAREQIKVQESNLDLLQQQLKTATDRYEAGTLSSFERLRAEVAVANAKVPLITARNNFRLAI